MSTYVYCVVVVSVVSMDVVFGFVVCVVVVVGVFGVDVGVGCCDGDGVRVRSVCDVGDCVDGGVGFASIDVDVANAGVVVGVIDDGYDGVAVFAGIIVISVCGHVVIIDVYDDDVVGVVVGIVIVCW